MTTIQDVVDYAKDHAKTRNWDRLTGAFFWHALGEDTTKVFATVNIACSKSKIISDNPEVAPAGAFHWWSGQYGQVALGTEPGDTKLLTVGRLQDGSFGPYVGFISNVKDMNMHYLGWSLDYAGQELE